MTQHHEREWRRLVDGLVGEVNIDGSWYGVDDARSRGFALTAALAGDARVLTVINRSGRDVRLGGFRWRASGPGGSVLPVPAERLRVYIEGWTMASPCGVRKYGDGDFRYNPEYLKFAMCALDEYSGATNHYHAEHAMAFSDCVSGETLLAGFISSARQFGRFSCVLDAQGVAEFCAVSDCSGAQLGAGETVVSEELAFFPAPSLYAAQCNFAECWGARMHARKRFAPPLGWCSWYYYFAKVREEDILENVRWFADHREEFPIEYIQLDDGYQRALGDWLVCNEKFPHGLRWLAAAIKRAGFKPALWLAPFQVEDNSELLREHPDWMIQNAQNAPCFPASWREGHKVAILDGSNPAVQDYFRTLFRTLREWGFDYVKLDFMVQGTVCGEGHFWDPRATRAAAFRKGLEAIREGFGEDGFILGCTAPFGQMVGLVDGERVSTDITPYWAPDRECFDEAPTVPNVCRNIIHHAYMNHLLWINDPDTHIARTDNNKLSSDEVELWTDAVRLGGGMLLFSDRFATLVPERAAFSKSLIADQDQYESWPVDALARPFPALWLGRHRGTGALLLGVFNLSDGAERIDLPAIPGKTTLKERKNGREVPLAGAINVLPHCVRLFDVR